VARQCERRALTVGHELRAERIFHYRHWILDLNSETWFRPPELDATSGDDGQAPRFVLGRGSVWAGDRIATFGGVHWDGPDGIHTNEAWFWKPN